MVNSSRAGRVSAAFITVLLVVPVVVLLSIVWAKMSLRQVADQAQATNETTIRAMGLRAAVSNLLDPAYKDADNDLIADPPSNPGALIDPPTLTFSYIATDDPEDYKKAFEDLTAHLSKSIGRPVEYMTFTSTEEELKAIRSAKLHIAGLNTGQVPRAVAACGFVPVATLGGANGKAMHHSEIIVQKSSSINAPEDLKDKELVLTEVGSNSGYKAPLVLLKIEKGILPLQDYLIRYSGGHFQSIEGVAKGQYQAVAVASDMLQRGINAGLIKPDQFRVVYKSENFPSAGFGHVYNLKPELAEKVKSALLSFDWKGTGLEKEFAGTDQSRFVPVNYRDDWSAVRHIDDKMGLSYQLK